MPTQTGDDKQNTLTGGPGNDLLYGLGDNDTLYGKGGNDTLDGGTGDDKMFGGVGNDIYYFDSTFDWAEELPNAGVDEIRSTVALSFAVSEVENYRFLTSDDVNFFANDLDNRVSGGSGNDTLFGVDGNDTLIGGKGDDWLDGYTGNDTLDGGDGNDRLDGFTGDDKMVGGKGNDVYFVDSAGDTVIESGNSGIDEIRTELNLKSATAGVENFTFLGNVSYTFTGNDLNNRITGNFQDDILSGAGGNDTLIGDFGNDILKGGNGNDRLEGGVLDDTLEGGAGNDILDGGDHFDKMSGGAGNDVYYVDQLGDVVIEAKDQGTDEVRVADFFSGVFTGFANVENYTFSGFQAVEFTGNKANNRIVGDQGSYTFSGGDGNDTISIGGGGKLYGDAGNDTLSGGDKFSLLYGGDGNDQLSGGEGGSDLSGEAGNDTLIGGVFYDTLSGGKGSDYLDGGGAIDKLDGGDGSDTLVGGAGGDILTGGAGNDLLISGAGDDDWLDGESGDDTLVVSNLDFYQAYGGIGNDTLQTSGTFNVDLGLYAGTTLQDIERIDLSNGGINILTLSQTAVHDVSSTTDQLIIDGDKNDGVNLDPAFAASGTQVVGGETYNVYKDGAGATLLLDQAITINPPAPISEFKLADLDGTNGYRLDASVAMGYVGDGVGSLGDWNGDGFADFMINPQSSSNSPDSSEFGYNITGYVVYGAATAPTTPFDLGSLNGSNGFTVINPPTNLSSPSTSSGDFNGDGKQDILISRNDHSYIVFGNSDKTGASIDLSTLDGTNGFEMGFGGTAAYAETNSFGDVNGDGFDDAVVGTPGSLYVVFGHADGTAPYVFPSQADVRISGPSSFGYSVSAAGDFNGDGIADIFTGNISMNGGKAYVVFGHSGAESWIGNSSELDGSNGFTLSGAPTLYFGLNNRAVDFNADGYDDVVAASLDTIYVIYGHSGTSSASVDVGALDGSNGFSITGGGSTVVEDAGDFNGDGYADLIIGAKNANDSAGAAYLVYGSAGGFGASIDVTALDGYNGFKIDGVDAGDLTGSSAVGAGDVNGDGYDDLLIGAFGASPNGVNAAGSAYIVYGHDMRSQVSYQGTTDDDVHTGTLDAEVMIGGLGNDTLTGGGGADVIRTGVGDDAIHVADTAFRNVDGGGGTDALHFDFVGALDLSAVHGKIEGVEVLDFDNGQANALTLHVADLLDIDATDLDVGGVSGLNDVLKIDGNVGDSLALTASEGWGAADTATLAGYAIYTTGAIKVAVDTDVSVQVS
jgi:Ca2+-binding RTX toxin-like protein